MSEPIITSPREYEERLLLDAFIREGFGYDNLNLSRLDHEGKDDILRELRAKKAGLI